MLHHTAVGDDIRRPETLLLRKGADPDVIDKGLMLPNSTSSVVAGVVVPNHRWWLFSGVPRLKALWPVRVCAGQWLISEQYAVRQVLRKLFDRRVRRLMVGR